MAGGDDEANVLHTSRVLSEHVFELNIRVIDESPNAHSTIIAAADDVRTKCILANEHISGP